MWILSPMRRIPTPMPATAHGTIGQPARGRAPVPGPLPRVNNDPTVLMVDKRARTKEKARAKRIYRSSGDKGGKGTGGDKSGKGAKHTPPALVPEPAPNWSTSSLTAPKEPVTPKKLTVAEQRLQELTDALHAEENTLSSRVQALLADQAQKTEQEVAKEELEELQGAASKVYQAKKQLSTARLARQALYQTWNVHIADSLARWRGYANEFQEQDNAITAKIEEASLALTNAQQKLDEAKDNQADAIEVETRCWRSDHGGYDRNGEEFCDSAATRRGICGRPTSSQETQRRSWRRWRSCAWKTWCWGIGAFWLGQAVDYSVIPCRPLPPISTNNWVLQWSHSVCLCDGFQSSWQACEKGHELARELGQSGSHVRPQSLGLTLPRTRCSSLPRPRKVHFDLQILVRFKDQHNTLNRILSHEFLRNWENKPWKLELQDYEHPEPRQTFRLLDDALPSLPSRVEGTRGTIPVGGVQIDQPDLRGVPAWIEQGWPLFERRAQVFRRGEGPTAYVRSWYLHHGRVRRWHLWRDFQLDEWPQHWQRRLQALWQDQLSPDEAWHVGWVTPEIPPIPGWENHLGDLIVWQPGEENRAAVLCHTLCSSPTVDRIQLQALSVPLQQGRHELLRLNHVMLQCWSSPCTIRRGTRTLLDGRLDHQDMSGLSIRVESALAELSVNLVQLRAVPLRGHALLSEQENLPPVDNVLTLSPTSTGAPASPDGPLSALAVLNTGESDAPGLPMIFGKV